MKKRMNKKKLVVMLVACGTLSSCAKKLPSQAEEIVVDACQAGYSFALTDITKAFKDKISDEVLKPIVYLDYKKPCVDMMKKYKGE